MQKEKGKPRFLALVPPVVEEEKNARRKSLLVLGHLVVCIHTETPAEDSAHGPRVWRRGFLPHRIMFYRSCVQIIVRFLKSSYLGGLFLCDTFGRRQID